VDPSRPVGSAMADVFVSYAKTDRSLASKLVAMLEAEGWKVWWDTSLGAADLHRDEIMKQLASARAVIAIWTPSIRSDWVRAEAGRAKAEGKLIPVKTPAPGYPHHSPPAIHARLAPAPQAPLAPFFMPIKRTVWTINSKCG